MKAKVYIGLKKYAVYIGRKIIEKTLEFLTLPARFISNKVQELKNLTMWGQSVQDGIPTPKTPIEVESVGVRTKNLFDGDLSMGVYNTTVGDTATKRFSSNRICSSSFTLISPNKTYIITGYKEGKTKWSWRLVLTDENNVITRLVNTNTFTANENETRLYFYVADDETSIEGYNLQIEQGSTATSYEPYGYKVPVVVDGKNLFDKDNIIEGYRLRNAINYEYDKGNDFVPEEGYYVSSLVEVKVGKTYIKNSPKADAFHRYHTYNADKVCVRYIETNTITINDGEKYIALCGKIEELDTTQLEEGETTTPYQPYIKPTTTNIYLDEPLRKLGEYADYIDYENQKVVRNIGYVKNVKYIGSKDSTGKLLQCTTPPNISIWTIASEKYNMISTYYENASLHYSRTGSGYYIVMYGGSIWIRDVDLLPVVVSQQDIEVGLCYQLSTPIEEQITLLSISLPSGTVTIDTDTNIKPSKLTITGDVDYDG